MPSEPLVTTNSQMRHIIIATPFPLLILTPFTLCHKKPKFTNLAINKHFPKLAAILPEIPASPHKFFVISREKPRSPLPNPIRRTRSPTPPSHLTLLPVYFPIFAPSARSESHGAARRDARCTGRSWSPSMSAHTRQYEALFLLSASYAAGSWGNRQKRSGAHPPPRPTRKSSTSASGTNAASPTKSKAKSATSTSSPSSSAKAPRSPTLNATSNSLKTSSAALVLKADHLALKDIEAMQPQQPIADETIPALPSRFRFVQSRRRWPWPRRRRHRRRNPRRTHGQSLKMSS